MRSLVVVSALLISSIIRAEVPLVYDVENTGAGCGVSLPDYDELPSIVGLPNPFEWSDGRGVISTAEEWTCRRAEIKAEIERYEIGLKPSRPANIEAVFNDGILTVTVKENGKTLVLSSEIILPEGEDPFPVIIGMNRASGSLDASLFEGIIQIPFMHNQIASYGMNGQKDLEAQFYLMYPELAGVGDYVAWAWGISRLIDGLELVKDEIGVNMQRIGVTGCSYAGKMALFAGAFDERIALTIAQESGGGGTASWRVSETLGNVEKISNTNYSWFMPGLKNLFDGQVEKLPYDHHELIAMIAPRAFLALGNDGWTWMADESGYIACRAAYEVWKFLGAEDRFGFDFTGGHQHCRTAESQAAAVKSFVDRFLRGSEEVKTDIFTHPYSDLDHKKWYSEWSSCGQ